MLEDGRECALREGKSAWQADSVAKKPPGGSQHMQASSCCCLDGRRCGKRLGKTHPDGQSEKQSRWRTAKSAVLILRESQCPMTGSTRDGQPLWAELCRPDLHSDLPYFFTWSGEVEPGAQRVTGRAHRHLRNGYLKSKRSTSRTLLAFPKFSSVIQWEETRSQR